MLIDHAFLDPPPQRTTETKTAIVGGGVIGLSLAWELTRRGHRVVLIDRDETVGQADSPSPFVDTNRCTSWTACGILPPAEFDLATDPLDRFRGYSHQVWPEWAERLQQLTGIDVGLVRCGGYYLAETVGEAAAMGGMIAYWAELNIECDVLSRTELLERLPFLSPWAAANPWIQKHPDRAAWWVPDEYQVRPSRMLTALHAVCRDAGVQFLHHSCVVGVEESECGVTVHAETPSSSSPLIADRVVLAGGAATGLIEPNVRLQNALIPIRGQILLLYCEAFDRPQVINIGNRYLVCRGDGNVLVGSCEEESGFAQHTTTEMISQLRKFATRVSPLLAEASEVQRWAGLRPMTFDGFPMIGRVPDHERTFVASGHYRSGIHFAPATAIAMADCIDHQPTFMDLSAFSVGKQQQQQQQQQSTTRTQ